MTSLNAGSGSSNIRASGRSQNLRKLWREMTMSKTDESAFVYVTYIRTTTERLWSALTSADFMKEYWFGMHIETEWKVGAPWQMHFADGRVADTGEIVELDPPKRLALKWRNEFRPELKAEGYSRCVIELEPVSDAVKLTIHLHHGPRGVKVHLGHVQWLAAYSLQPEMPARNRPDCV